MPNLAALPSGRRSAGALRRSISRSSPGLGSSTPASPRLGAAHRRFAAGAGLLAPRLALLEALHDLVDDALRRDLRAADGDVEVVGLLEAELADDVGQQRRAGQLLGRQPRLVEVLLQQLAAGVLGVVARLRLEPGFDLVAGAGRLDQREPVT